MPISCIKIRDPGFCSILEYTVSDEHFHLIFLFRFLILRSGVFRIDLVPAAVCGRVWRLLLLRDDGRTTDPTTKQASKM